MMDNAEFLQESHFKSLPSDLGGSVGGRGRTAEVGYDSPQGVTTDPPGGAGGKPPPSLDSSSGITSHRTLTLYCHDCQTPKVVTLKCSKRSCVDCRKRVYWKLCKGWEPLVIWMDHPKLLTLTVRNLTYITRDDIKRIRSQFIRLLRRKYYAVRIKGGLYAIELVNKGRGWNLHIHALIETVHGSMGYVAWQHLSKDWLSITGDSMIIHIEDAGTARAALKYILKYFVKAPEVSGQEDEYDRVMKGFRLIQTFGNCFGTQPERARLTCSACGGSWWVSEFKAPREWLTRNLEPGAAASVQRFWTSA